MCMFGIVLFVAAAGVLALTQGLTTLGTLLLAASALTVYAAATSSRHDPDRWPPHTHPSTTHRFPKISHAHAHVLDLSQRLRQHPDPDTLAQWDQTLAALALPPAPLLARKHAYLPLCAHLQRQRTHLPPDAQPALDALAHALARTDDPDLAHALRGPLSEP